MGEDADQLQQYSNDEEAMRGDNLSDLVKEFSPEEIQVRLSGKTQALAQELATKQREAIKLKIKLLDLNIRINQIAYKELPELFQLQNVHAMTLDNGIVLELSPFFKASLPVDMDPVLKEKALAYLRENAPEIVKTDVVVSYDVGEMEMAQELARILTEMGAEPVVSESVHHMTLTSWVRGQFIAGEEVPFDTLNASVGSYVSVKFKESEMLEALKRIKGKKLPENPAG